MGLLWSFDPVPEGATPGFCQLEQKPGPQRITKTSSEPVLEEEDRHREHERDAVPEDDRPLAEDDPVGEPKGEAEGNREEHAPRDVIRGPGLPDLADLRHE